MLKSIFISFLALITVSLYAKESLTMTSIHIDESADFQEVETSQGWLKGVQSIRLNRKGIDAYYTTVYLVATDSETGVFIFDTLEDAFACKFWAFDIDGDGVTELLVTYSTGAYMHRLKIYDIASSDKRKYNPKDIKKWEDVSIYSGKFGRDGIEIEQGKIETLNLNIEDNNKVDINTYKVENKKVILIKTITE